MFGRARLTFWLGSLLALALVACGDDDGSMAGEDGGPIETEDGGTAELDAGRDEPDAGACTGPCDPVDQTCCPAGDGCYLPAAGPTCSPAGDVPEGGSCADSPTACAPGHLCVISGDQPATCRRLCRTTDGAEACGEGFTCSAVPPHPPYGWCSPN